MGRDRRTVNGTLNMLHAAGYACFWVLTNSLLPASGACWIREFGGKPAWSNMLCVHEPPVFAALSHIAQESHLARKHHKAKPFVGGRAIRGRHIRGKAR